MSGLGNDGMDQGSMMESEDRIDKTVDIYITAEAVRDIKHKKDTEDFDTQTAKTQTPQHTGSDSVRNRSSRVAAVCLVLLCVLLLTAVIVLCVTFTQERQQFISKNENMTNERDQLISNNENLTNERNQLISKNENLTNERDQLRNNLQSSDGWTYYKSSFYYMPNETKSWNESRRYCTERGADLIIINNREEQDFVKNMTGKAIVWIGLTDSVVENTWKWVDGSTLTSGFWGSGEPNGGTRENCVLTVAVPKLPEWPNLVGWLDDACTKPFKWICEKSISQLILP
ncbi:C-type lectin domain family 10 member A-like [Rhinichthys klamathensis goyatoka]|uniref:C-type lectin domain family 10 member A-like n=1 Tax=Rhinichthys klamathensis goyatoka TaxID=3034132 RepID=UPI0024B4A7A5|nr:C-type lectin domain family 10 member A-like [Rhinichthys klamathensis goyatoka]